MELLKFKNNNTQGLRRVNYINEESDDEVSDDNKKQLVLQIDGIGSNSFYLKGNMCGIYFKAIIDTGFSVSIFTKRYLQKIIGERKVVIRVVQ